MVLYLIENFHEKGLNPFPQGHFIDWINNSPVVLLGRMVEKDNFAQNRKANLGAETHTTWYKNQMFLKGNWI